MESNQSISGNVDAQSDSEELFQLLSSLVDEDEQPLHGSHQLSYTGDTALSNVLSTSTPFSTSTSSTTSTPSSHVESSPYLASKSCKLPSSSELPTATFLSSPHVLSTTDTTPEIISTSKSKRKLPSFLQSSSSVPYSQTCLWSLSSTQASELRKAPKQCHELSSSDMASTDISISSTSTPLSVTSTTLDASCQYDNALFRKMYRKLYQHVLM